MEIRRHEQRGAQNLYPFSTGAGTQPPELVGRQEILDQILNALARIRMGRPEKSALLIGLRGVGKTVLLNRIQELAEENKYETMMIEAREDKPLPLLLMPYLRQVLLRLDRGKSINGQVSASWVA